MGLNPVEHAAIRIVRWLVVQRTLLAVLAGALVTWWLMRRCQPTQSDGLAASRPPSAATCAAGRSDPYRSTTLYDPERLQTALSLFAETGTGAHATNADVRMRTETLCRTLLQEMLGYELPKVRPKWLVNPTTKRSLELDMYNAERRIAFEVDGAQHEVYTPHFHGSREQFQYRRLLDQLKNELCHEHGVRLLRIPYHEVSASNELKTARYLERMLNVHGIPFRALPLPPGNKQTDNSMDFT